MGKLNKNEEMDTRTDIQVHCMHAHTQMNTHRTRTPHTCCLRKRTVWLLDTWWTPIGLSIYSYGSLSLNVCRRSFEHSAKVLLNGRLFAPPPVVGHNYKLIASQWSHLIAYRYATISMSSMFVENLWTSLGHLFDERPGSCCSVDWVEGASEVEKTTIVGWRCAFK